MACCDSGMRAAVQCCLREGNIVEANRELDAAVAMTEAAAMRIIEAAEAILAADPSDTAAYRETVNGEIQAIFEACAFQDITGQRLAKVRGWLETVSVRVARLANTLEADHACDGGCEKRNRRAGRDYDLMLNGPARAGEGQSQAEIDALLAKS